MLSLSFIKEIEKIIARTTRTTRQSCLLSFRALSSVPHARTSLGR